MQPTRAMRELARAGEILVASDFDGTLAPIAAEPSQVVPDRRALDALWALAQLPRTHVALVSGRARKDLALLVDPPGDVLLVGSHGAEFGGPIRLHEREQTLRARLLALLRGTVPPDRGFLVEEKPAGAALHYRNVDEREAAEVLRVMRERLDELHGVHVREGKCVLELLAVATDKGKALQRMRAALRVESILFVGDDGTDEDAFAALGPADVGVKVGSEPSVARWRLKGQEQVAPLLETLLSERSRATAAR